jgi:hypothetical protein
VLFASALSRAWITLGPVLRSPNAVMSIGVVILFRVTFMNETAPGRPVSAATLNRIHAALRAALNGAVRAGLIPVNPGSAARSRLACPRLVPGSPGMCSC